MKLELSQKLRGCGKIAHEKGVIFHTDAARAVGHIPIDVEKMNIDMMSMSRPQNLWS